MSKPEKKEKISTNINLGIPPKGTPEYQEFADRVIRRREDLALGISMLKDLPSVIAIIIYDQITGRYIASCADLEYLPHTGPGKRVSLNFDPAIPLKEDSPDPCIGRMLKDLPNVPLLCDEYTAEQIRAGSLTFIEDEHYRLYGRPEGVLEVFTPYKTKALDMSEKDLEGAERAIIIEDAILKDNPSKDAGS